MKLRRFTGSITSILKKSPRFSSSQPILSPSDIISSRKDEVEHQKKAETIVNTVLDLVDKNKDGRISLEEFKSVGLDGLPNFDDLGAEGHHYDVESGAYRFAMSFLFFHVH